MNNPNKAAYVLLIIATCWLTACAMRPNDPRGAELAPVTVTVPTAEIRLVVKAAGQPGVRAAITAVPDGAAAVVVDAVLNTIGQGAISTQTRQVTLAANEVATITFTDVPVRTALARLTFTNGKVRGATAFHGTLDLQPGSNNTLYVVEVASNSRESIAANVVSRVMVTPTLVANATSTLAAAALAAVDRINTSAGSLNGGTARQDAFNSYVASAPTTTGANVTVGSANLTCTLIMHGFDLGTGGEPAWMEPMQNAIIARSGQSGKKGRIVVTGTKGNLTATCDPWNFALDSATTGEIVVRVDWSAVANHLVTGVTAQEVAAAIVPKIFEGQAGQRALAEMPIHLIGHSRGGGMVYELARLLGEKGVEVDHVTSLDPHPLTTADTQPLPFVGPPVIDTAIKVYENVLFADSYWQGIAYPKGELVPGAYNRLWSLLANGYHQAANTSLQNFADHLNIILMYHATTDLSQPVSNVEATLSATDRAAWFNAYESSGEKTGLYYSRNLAASSRLSTDAPVQGGDQVKAGYHNNGTLGGAGARQSLTWSGAVWPNVMTVDILRGGVPLAPGTQTITPGESLEIGFSHRDYDSASSITLYVDQDRNPYNGNNLATIGSLNLAATGQVITRSSVTWNTTGLSATARFYVCAAVTDGTRTRYLYW